MNALNESNTAISANAVDTAKGLRKLYFLRVAFSVIWVTLVSVFAKTNFNIACVLLVIYPVWDVIATLLDINANPPSASKTPQYVNIGIGVFTTIGVIVALQSGVPGAIMVFGVWAIVTGLIQLILGLHRRKALGGQWPMIISGAQSMLAGTLFIIQAHKPNMGISSLAGYSAFGAFYFLLTAIRLSKTIKSAEKSA